MPRPKKSAPATYSWPGDFVRSEVSRLEVDLSFAAARVTAAEEKLSVAIDEHRAIEMQLEAARVAIGGGK